MRSAMTIPAACALLLLGTAPAAPAQSFDGTYAGTIGCQSRGGLKPLQTPLSMTVAGNTATFEREIIRPGSNCPAGGCRTGNFERGTGTVTSSGEVALRGKAEGKGTRDTYSFDSEYRGQLGAPAVSLTGTQRWVVNGQAEAARPCEINLSAPKQ